MSYQELNEYVNFSNTECRLCGISTVSSVGSKQLCSSTCCWHCRSVSLYTNCEAFNSLLHSALWETVNELWELQQFASRTVRNMFVKKMRAPTVRFTHQYEGCFECTIVWSSLRVFLWVPGVERLISPIRLSDLAFIFQFDIEQNANIVLSLCSRFMGQSTDQNIVY